MTFAPVGIRCPEHANIGAPARSPQRTVRQARGRASSVGAPATIVLVALNVLVYLVTVSQGGGLNAPGGEVFQRGALVGVFVADGGWYRLLSAMFLHASLMHLAFNMLALWWLGSIVEQAVGTLRYLLLYFVSGLAGSAGALIEADPAVATVGASGAVYGILGALVVLEWRHTGTIMGPALTLIVLNLAITFTIPNISRGGHIGGLIGGVLAAFALDQTRLARNAAVGPILVVLVGVISVALAYFRVENYVL